MPRYAILRHDWPVPHLDLLLEAGPVLRAWRLAAEPVAGVWVPAEPNADHRLMYLDYEGPVSGGRGSVSRWAAGTFEGDIRGDEWSVEWDGGTAEFVGGRFRVTASPRRPRWWPGR